MGVLYIVATPIGNLEDITVRALRVLREVDLVLCEDTRVTRTLLGAHGISARVMSYHSHSGRAKAEKVLAALSDGKSVALVSDAGTPTISDPGSSLVALVRERLPEAPVVPVPGASAVVAALSASGLPSSEFLFLGFLPRKKGRRAIFSEITESKRTVVFYESPHRVIKTLESLAGAFSEAGQEGRRVAVAREITKIHEEFVSGTPREILAHYEKHRDRVRGEFVVMVEGASRRSE